ncbi:carboxy terminal-processing peptidase [Luteimonas sp. 8-5]|uniref:carboxy terminal-processing peptidase n=1 Tax=Luteimonas sp. 8-5 TaxID=3039387 RepID=UPI002436D8F6|nr:carboxy terminal-processing peptidase [Luteimonas sp. 8-5]MDG6347662.1 carboxy terminal-processing peptidase [Luteimonas sp. 8-5]
MKLPHSLLILALATPLALFARPGADTIAPGPTADQATTAKLVYGLLSDSRYAYRPQALDDALSKDIFKRYLDALDRSKMFFTADDVAKFARYKLSFDDAIKGGKLDPAYAMFALYKQRVAERSAYASGLLKQDIFDFGGDERWYYDREDAPWATAAELDELWKQSVRNDWLRLKLAGKEPAEIRKVLAKRYGNFAESTDELDSTDAFSSFLNAYTASIDPHTNYLDPRSAERFNQSMSLSLEGIGAQLQKQDDVVVIREVLPGGPAIKSGKLQAGDRIVGVGQGASGPMEDVVGWRIDDVVEKIKGPKGTQVRLDIVPPEAGLDSQPVRVSLVRDKIRLSADAAKSKILDIPARGDLPARRIGVIELPGFYQDFAGRRDNANGDYASATRDVARLLGEMNAKKVDGVVMDLRNNGGGSLAEAIELTGLFIDQGPVVQVRESGGRVSVEGDRKAGVAWEGPLAVLVNRGSASASEIFAGAIQDYGRGLIIGEQTFGKGTVQNLVDLDRWPANEKPRFGQVKLTIAQFFLPGGASTQNKGVHPDIAFPVTVDASEFGESTYDNALPWTRIAAVPHVRYGNFTPILAKLDELHDARVKDNPEFQWWAQDVADFRTERAKKFVSLNEAERRRERDADAAKRAKRQELRKELGLKLDPLAAESADDGLQASERDIVADAARQKAAEERPDPLLRESAAILADATAMLARDKQLAALVLPETGRATHWAE